MREGAGQRFDDLELEIGAYFIAVSDHPREAAEALGKRFGVSADDVLGHPHALVGTITDICDTLRHRREALGISYITVAQRHLDEFAPVVAQLAGQ